MSYFFLHSGEDEGEPEPPEEDPTEYMDTTAPANGDGRYYRCIVSATGSSSATSTANRGYRMKGGGLFTFLG